jgi:hypothetical protein
LFITAILAARVPAGAAEVGNAPAIGMAESWSYFVSARPEFLAVFGEITSAGFAAEFGLMDFNGLFFSAELNGGAYYGGFGLNAGYSSVIHDLRFDSPFDELRFTAGVYVGFHHVTIPVNLESESGERLGRIYGSHRGMAGLFWKFTCGYIDVTNRLLFGYRNRSPWYDEAVNDIVRKRYDGLVYTIGIGYTLTKERGR